MEIDHGKPNAKPRKRGINCETAGSSTKKEPKKDFNSYAQHKEQHEAAAENVQ